MEKRDYHRKSVDELTFADDYMFGEVMKDPEICAHVIEVLLRIKVGKIIYPERQKVLKESYESKGIRFDVYVKDSDRVFDIEIQCKTVSDLPKRTRYYQSMIDMDNLLKGKTYDELPESFIIFICKNDPFDLDLPQYTFRNKCLEERGLYLDDKTTKVIYNASAYREEKDEEVRAFLKYVYTNDPGKNGFSSRLSAIVENIKLNDIFRSQYLAMNLHDRDLIRQAKKEGASQKAIEAAENFLREGISIEIISRCTGLPLEKVRELAENILVKN